MESFTFVLQCSCILLFSFACISKAFEVSNKSLLETFSNIVTTSDMTSVVIYGNSEERLTRDVDLILDEHFVKRTITDEISSLKIIIENEINKVAGYSDVTDMTSNLNFIVLCNNTCVRSLLDNVQKIHFKYGQLVLRHYSRWMILLSERAKTTEFKSLMFDNSLVISFTQNKSVVVETMLLTSGRKYLQRLGHLHTKNVFPNMEYGMKETQLTVAALEWAPYTKETTLDDGTLDFVGISKEILHRLAVTFNFTYRFVMPEDKAWGTKDENGNWTGIIGMVQTSEVDLCISPYVWNPARSKVMEFGYYFGYDDFVAIYKKKPTQRNQWTFITTSFKLEVYLYWLLSLVVVLGSFLMFEIFNVKNRQSKSWLTVVGIATFAIRIPLQQASPDFPLSRSSRVLLCFWWLLTIVMTAAYMGNMMASLAVSTSDVPFNTLKELAADDLYSVGVFKETQMEVFLRVSKVKMFQDIWEKVFKFRQSESSRVFQDDLKHHVNLLSSGGYVFLTTTNIATEIMSMECDVKIMKEIVLPLKGGFVFPLGFPLTRMFSEKIRIMIETGLVDLWRKNWTPKKRICSLPVYVEAQSLDVDMMFGAIIVALVGIGTALSVLSLERGYTYFIKSTKN